MVAERGNVGKGKGGGLNLGRSGKNGKKWAKVV